MNCAVSEVLNQSSELIDYNLFSTHSALKEALAREGAATDHAALEALGAQLGTAEMFALGEAANRNPPELQMFDRLGARRDEVQFHPAWHELLRRLVGAGLHTGPWAEPRRGAHVARAAGYMLWAEVENGTQCPATMSYGAVPALAAQEQDFAPWLQLLLSREYDARFLPAADKRGALIGMGMTERQGGSDVRTNTTRAVPAGARGPGHEYRLTGHKWFFSAPMCDAFLVLAQAPGGLSCFLVPRFLPDRRINQLHLQRLKDKVGNRSNASSGGRVRGCVRGTPRGGSAAAFPQILTMGVYTRLDNAVASAGLMRQCVSQAIHHARDGRGLRPLSRRAAADDERPCGSGARVRGGRGAGDAARARIRWACRRGSHAAAARADAGGQVLALQARRHGMRRGDGGARRQRLRRGGSDRPALPGIAAGLHLGGLGQHHVPGRAAGADARAAHARGARAAPRGRKGAR